MASPEGRPNREFKQEDPVGCVVYSIDRAVVKHGPQQNDPEAYRSMLEARGRRYLQNRDTPYRRPTHGQAVESARVTPPDLYVDRRDDVTFLTVLHEGERVTRAFTNTPAVARKDIVDYYLDHAREPIHTRTIAGAFGYPAGRWFESRIYGVVETVNKLPGGPFITTHQEDIFRPRTLHATVIFQEESRASLERQNYFVFSTEAASVVALGLLHHPQYVERLHEPQLLALVPDYETLGAIAELSGLPPADTPYEAIVERIGPALREAQAFYGRNNKNLNRRYIQKDDPRAPLLQYLQALSLYKTRYRGKSTNGIGALDGYFSEHM